MNDLLDLMNCCEAEEIEEPLSIIDIEGLLILIEATPPALFPKPDRLAPIPLLLFPFKAKIEE